MMKLYTIKEPKRATNLYYSGSNIGNIPYQKVFEEHVRKSKMNYGFHQQWRSTVFYLLK